MAHRGQNRTILIVEDNDDDFEAVESAFHEGAGAAVTISRSASGHDALDFLLKQGPYAPPNDQPLPALMVLDLNLLGVSGREVLDKVKNDDNLKRIPVIVMSSSSDERDIDACYRVGANAYVQKPMELGGLFDAVANLKSFWFETVILPS